ncbi:MAG TPA: hypothetical protein VEM93_09580 [Actinomycetota bacterium]|nr:hypothetical protein [Actinomycetota bacterium]
MVFKTIGLTDPLTTGEDVKTVQRLLVENPFQDFKPGEIDGKYGTITAHATNSAKWLLGMRKKELNNLFGPVLHDYLSGAQGLPLLNKIRRQRRLKAVQLPAVRDAMVSWCRWGIEHEPDIHYAKDRPIPSPPAGTVPLTTDCSGSTIIFAHWAGVPPHPGMDYNGGGSSETMSDQLRQLSRQDIRPGDLVIWPRHHVAVVMELGEDPLLETHGLERGPMSIRLSAEADFHRSEGHGEPKFYSLLESA